MRITLVVRLSLVSSKNLSYDSFVFVTNIEIANSTDEVPHAPPTTSWAEETLIKI